MPPMPLGRAAFIASGLPQKPLAAEEAADTDTLGKDILPTASDQLTQGNRRIQISTSSEHEGLDGGRGRRGGPGQSPTSRTQFQLSDSARLNAAQHMQLKHEFKYQHHLDRHLGKQQPAPPAHREDNDSELGGVGISQRMLTRQRAFRGAQREGSFVGIRKDYPHLQVRCPTYMSHRRNVNYVNHADILVECLSNPNHLNYEGGQLVRADWHSSAVHIHNASKLIGFRINR